MNPIGFHAGDAGDVTLVDLVGETAAALPPTAPATLGEVVRAAVARAYLDLGDAAVADIVAKARPAIEAQLVASGLPERAKWSPEQREAYIKASVLRQERRAIDALKASRQATERQTITKMLDEAAWQLLDGIAVSPVGDGSFVAANVGVRVGLASSARGSRP